MNVGLLLIDVYVSLRATALGVTSGVSTSSIDVSQFI